VLEPTTPPAWPQWSVTTRRKESGFGVERRADQSRRLRSGDATSTSQRRRRELSGAAFDPNRILYVCRSHSHMRPRWWSRRFPTRPRRKYARLRRCRACPSGNRPTGASRPLIEHGDHRWMTPAVTWPEQSHVETTRLHSLGRPARVTFC